MLRMQITMNIINKTGIICAAVHFAAYTFWMLIPIRVWVEKGEFPLWYTFMLKILAYSDIPIVGALYILEKINIEFPGEWALWFINISGTIMWLFIGSGIYKVVKRLSKKQYT